jgi:moderate conductance mechanosensitive channel
LPALSEAFPINPVPEVLPALVSYLVPPRQPSSPVSCTDAREVCERIYQWTGVDWLAQGSYLLLVKPLRIVFIIVLAVVARFVIHRLISRITHQAATARPGLAVLRPLRARMPGAAPTGGTGIAERRRARMAALGSILRSIASTVLFTITSMLVLAEIGVNLAPILAGAGILGVAVGFGAQNLVRDFLSGLFMLFEDQYGVGDCIKVGDTTGTVEAVGLRITTVRDADGVIWYIRNGEILRVGNKSQGWSLLTVDVPVGFTDLDTAAEVLRKAAEEFTRDEDWGKELINPPEVLGVEEITPDGAVVRTSVKTNPQTHAQVARQLRRQLTEALDASGIAARLKAGPPAAETPVPDAVPSGAHGDRPPTSAAHRAAG